MSDREPRKYTRRDLLQMGAFGGLLGATATALGGSIAITPFIDDIARNKQEIRGIGNRLDLAEKRVEDLINQSPDLRLAANIGRLKVEVKSWHDDPEIVQVLPYETSGTMDDLLSYYYQETQSRINQTVILTKGNPEIFFAPVRLAKQDSDELVKPLLSPGIFPVEYPDKVFRDLIENVPESPGAISGFTQYSVFDIKYSDKLGSIQTVFPAETLPKDRFILAFSRKTLDRNWLSQTVSALALEVGLYGIEQTKNVIFVNMESYNPNIAHPFSTTQKGFENPTNDMFAVLVTDTQGKIVQKKLIEQPHFPTERPIANIIHLSKTN